MNERRASLPSRSHSPDTDINLEPLNSEPAARYKLPVKLSTARLSGWEQSPTSVSRARHKTKPSDLKKAPASQNRIWMEQEGSIQSNEMCFDQNPVASNAFAVNKQAPPKRARPESQVSTRHPETKPQHPMSPTELIHILEEVNVEETSKPGFLHEGTHIRKRPSLTLEELGDILCHINVAEATENAIRWDVIAQVVCPREEGDEFYFDDPPFEIVEFDDDEWSTVSSLSIEARDATNFWDSTRDIVTLHDL